MSRPVVTPILTAIAIVGIPAIVAPGDSVQLSASGRFDSGDTSDVTEKAVWLSSDEAACRVSASGLLTGVGGGQARIEVRVGDVFDARDVTCGYVIDVSVHESEPTAQVAVANARVEAVGGALDGQTFLTDAQGRATLPVVGSGGFALKFKKNGYDDGQWVVVLPRDRSLSIALVPNSVVTAAWSGTLTTDLSSGSVRNTISGWPGDYTFQPHRASDLTLDLQVGCVAFGTYTDFGFTLQTDSGRSVGALWAYGVAGPPYRYSVTIPLAAAQGYRLVGTLGGFLGGPCPWSLSVRRPG
ncbi:MAG: Ig-like domain-containing protein [Vicinamibacterales bacterium]